MDTKKNLNNVQRKMLDEIYREQFDKKANLIRQERQAGYAKLQAQLLAKEAQNGDVKEMLLHAEAFYLMYEKLKPQLAAKGVSVDCTLNRVPQLIVDRWGDKGKYPELEEYQAETNRIEVDLGEKKKLMRAKIYGVAASYEEVDKEISELLKDS